MNTCFVLNFGNMLLIQVVKCENLHIIQTNYFDKSVRVYGGGSLIVKLKLFNF